jgi:hypothetical protein
MASRTRGYLKAGLIGAAVGLAAFAVVTEAGPRFARRMMRH